MELQGRFNLHFLMARDVKNLEIFIGHLYYKKYVCTERETQTHAHCSEIQLIKIFHAFCRLSDTLLII